MATPLVVDEIHVLFATDLQPVRVQLGEVELDFVAGSSPKFGHHQDVVEFHRALDALVDGGASAVERIRVAPHALRGDQFVSVAGLRVGHHLRCVGRVGRAVCILGCSR